VGYDVTIRRVTHEEIVYEREEITVDAKGRGWVWLGVMFIRHSSICQALYLAFPTHRYAELDVCNFCSAAVQYPCTYRLPDVIISVWSAYQRGLLSSGGCFRIPGLDRSFGLGRILCSVHILGLADSLGCSHQTGAAVAEGGSLAAIDAVEVCTHQVGILPGVKVCTLDETGHAVVGTHRVLGVCTLDSEACNLDSVEACSLDSREVCSLGPVEACNPGFGDQVGDPAGTAKEDYTAAVHTDHPAKKAQAGRHHQGSKQKALQR
jgi:hypothetical protein